MIKVRLASERGGSDHGWLKTLHTFSFADFHDPDHMGFRVLRVMNEDRVAPGKGFGTHPHRDMEIISYVLQGSLEHKDSLGHGAVLRPGEVQRITAGTGVEHSEFNPSLDEPVHFYQVWLLPDRRGHTPNYAQMTVPREGRRGRWQLIISPDGRDSSLPVQQNASILLADLAVGEYVRHPFAVGRHGWLQILRGEVKAGGQRLFAGDGLAVSNETSIAVEGVSDAEVMLFDLP